MRQVRLCLINDGRCQGNTCSPAAIHYNAADNSWPAVYAAPDVVTHWPVGCYDVITPVCMRMQTAQSAGES